MDLADNLFRQVFHGDDTGCAGVLVEYHGDLDVLAAEAIEHVVQRQRFGHEDGGAHQLDEAKFLFRLEKPPREVFDMQDADDVIAVFSVDGKARMRLIHHGSEGVEWFERGRQGHHACTRGHDLADGALVEVDHILQKDLLGGAKEAAFGTFFHDVREICGRGQARFGAGVRQLGEVEQPVAQPVEDGGEGAKRHFGGGHEGR